MKQSLSLVSVVVRDPKTGTYGSVAVFRDIYGNLWDLLQPTATASFTKPGL